MELDLEIAIARTHKYGSRESGDSAEVVERPGGGAALLVVDGQGSGRGARAISEMVIARVIPLVRDGVRDEVVASAANDILLAHRHGQVSATLGLVTVDPSTGEIAITHQGETASFVATDGRIERLDGPTPPLGRYRGASPRTWRYPLRPDLTVIVTTDGVLGAGRRAGRGIWDPTPEIAETLAEASARRLAEHLLAHSAARDDGRLADDATVGVIRIAEAVPGASLRLQTLRTPMVVVHGSERDDEAGSADTFVTAGSRRIGAAR